MNIDDFFDRLFPGDSALNIPSFEMCDNQASVSGFLQTVPVDFINELKGRDFLESTPDEMLKEIKSRGIDLKPVINLALSFYFSRPSVVISLTGRSVPLTTSGLAKY